MKIGIDARMYGPKQGGLGRYAEQLIKHLETTDFQNKYVIFLRKENWDDFTPANANFKKVLADIPWYGFSEQLKMPAIIRGQNLDLMHFPHWNVPYFYNGPFVVTIHDLLLLHYPTRKASALGPLSYWFKNFAFRITLHHAINKALRIIAPCEYTKNDIEKTLKIAPEKISVTLLAPMPKPAVPDDRPEILKKYYITKPYALYVGVAYPHKNLEGLVAAWKIFEEKYGDGYQLVLAGKNNFFYNRLTNGAIYKECKNIIYTGYLGDADLAQFFSSASLYVFPSFYEGFGLPPLEALQYGVPVVSSNATCLPEILGNAAGYFNPQNPQDIAQKLYAGFTDRDLRAKLIGNSKAILSKYSWPETARQTFSIYSQVLFAQK